MLSVGTEAVAMRMLLVNNSVLAEATVVLTEATVFLAEANVFLTETLVVRLLEALMVLEGLDVGLVMIVMRSVKSI